jgi:hypothetical protein
LVSSTASSSYGAPPRRRGKSAISNAGRAACRRFVTVENLAEHGLGTGPWSQRCGGPRAARGRQALASARAAVPRDPARALGSGPCQPPKIGPPSAPSESDRPPAASDPPAAASDVPRDARSIRSRRPATHHGHRRAGQPQQPATCPRNARASRSQHGRVTTLNTGKRPTPQHQRPAQERRRAGNRAVGSDPSRTNECSALLVGTDLDREPEPAPAMGGG